MQFKMKAANRNACFMVCILLAFSCTSSKMTAQINLVGSTPGDQIIKTMLGIPAETKVDFMRWDLVLSHKKTFVLHLVFGESKPNTLDFEAPGRLTFNGTYKIERNKGENMPWQEVFTLTSDSIAKSISLVKINERLYHIVSPQNQLMVGNGGWSYSLNREDSVDPGTILIASPVVDEKSLSLIYDGRSPCQEIASLYPEMRASSTCFKLKWRLVLNRDPLTLLPTTCTLRTIVDNIPLDVSGSWSITKQATPNEGLLVYNVHLDGFAHPFLLLLGDGKVLYFLDNQYNPIIGNGDFSFTLNKRPEK